MSALQNYLAAVRRQFEFLDWVCHLDEKMERPDPPPERDHRGRRHWTKQDGNRWSYKAATSDIHDGDLSELDKNAAVDALEPPDHMRPRILYVVRMCRRWLASAKGEALAEAGAGGFSWLVPQIIEVFEAHDNLCANLAAPFNLEIDWSERDPEGAKERYLEAVRRLELHMPERPPAPPAAAAIKEIALKPNQQCIVETIRSVGRRLTSDALLAELASRGLASSSATKQQFAFLIQLGELDNETDEFGTGYGLPEWSQQS